MVQITIPPSHGPNPSIEGTLGRNTPNTETAKNSQAAARNILQDIRTKLTLAGSVETGYLSLSRESDGTINLSNRSRFNVVGDKVAAAELIKQLVQDGYGSSIGSESLQEITESFDSYVGDKWFGKKLGTVSFVKLVNALEENIGGNTTPQQKSGINALFGAGGSLTVDEAGIAEGVDKVRSLRHEHELTTLIENATALLNVDTADAVSEVCQTHIRITQHLLLLSDLTQPNERLNELANTLVDLASHLVEKCNTDLCARTNEIRSEGNSNLPEQIERLQSLNQRIDALPSDNGTVIKDSTRRTIEAAIDEAMTAYSSVETPLARAAESTINEIEENVEPVIDPALERGVKTLVKSAADLMGVRVDNIRVQAKSTFNQRDLAQALELYTQMDSELISLRQRIGDMDEVRQHPALLGLQHELRSVQSTLQEHMRSEVLILLRQCQQTAITEANKGNISSVLNQGAHLSALDQLIENSGNSGTACLGGNLIQNIKTSLSDVMNAVAGSFEFNSVQGELESLRANVHSFQELPNNIKNANDLLQRLNLVARFVPDGPLATNIAALQVETSLLVKDRLGDLESTLRRTAVESKPRYGANNAVEIERGQIMSALKTETLRLQTLTESISTYSSVRTELLGMVASFDSLLEQEAMSLLVNWQSSDGSQRRMPPGLKSVIEESPNHERVISAIVKLYENGLFNLGDSFMARLAGVLDRGDNVRTVSKAYASERGVDHYEEVRVDPVSLKWILELADGDPQAVNGLLNEPQWDDIALNLLQSAPDKSNALAQAQVVLNKEKQIVLRELDSILRRTNPAWGTGGKISFNPLNQQGMQSLRLDTPTIEALLKASSPEFVNRMHTIAPGQNVTLLDLSDIDLLLGYLIASETPQGTELTEAADIGKQKLAKEVLLQLPYMKALGMSSETSASELIAKALEWGSGTQTDVKGMLAAADKIRIVSGKLSKNASVLLDGLKNYETTRDKVRVEADEQFLRLKGYLFSLDKNDVSTRKAEFETDQELYTRLAKPLQTNLNTAENVNRFVDALATMRDFDFRGAVDLGVVREMAARVVSEDNTGHIGTNGVLSTYFGTSSATLRADPKNIGSDRVIRANLSKLKMANHLTANGTAASFQGLADAVERGASSAMFKQGRPGLNATQTDWFQFVTARNATKNSNPPLYGPDKPGRTAVMGNLLRITKDVTVARTQLTSLWNDLSDAVMATSENAPAADMVRINKLADRYLALVEIGESNAAIQSAISELKDSSALRQAAARAIPQIRSANPEAQRVAMLMILDLFRSTNLRDLNEFRTALLSPTDGSAVNLESKLEMRFREIGLEYIAGTKAVMFCKAVLISEENANNLLDDHPEGWTGKATDALTSMGLNPEPTMAKDEQQILMREEITTGLSRQLGQLYPGQSFEIRASQSGEVEFTIPTTLPSVDATAGFSFRRDNSLTIRMVGDNQFSIVGKYSDQGGVSGGASLVGGALSVRAGLDANIGAGFVVDMDSAEKTIEFLRTILNPGSEAPLELSNVFNEAARTRVLDSNGLGIGVEARANLEAVSPEIMGLSLGMEVRATTGAKCSRESSTETSGVQTIQTTTLKYEYGASIGAEFGVRNAVESETDTVDEAMEEEDEDMQNIGVEASATGARSRFDEQTIVTRRGQVHASSSFRQGFIDHPSTIEASAPGLNRSIPLQPTLLEQRIESLLSGTPFENQLSDNKSNLQSAVRKLIALAANGPYEISVSADLKPDIALSIAELRQCGNSSAARKLLADSINYNPKRLELIYLQGPGVGEPVYDTEERENIGLEDLGLSVFLNYENKGQATKSTKVVCDLDQFRQ